MHKFWVVTAFLIAGAALLGGWSSAQAALRTQDRQLAFSREAKLARTINIGRWFGRGVPATDRHYANYIAASEARRIHDWGFTAVRLPIQEPFLFVSSASEARLDPKKLGFLDAAIQRLNEAGLVVIVDFHSKERSKHETDIPYQERMMRFWKLLATHLASTDPNKVYFELLNEPRFLNNPQAWNGLQKQLYYVVRKAAPAHTIIATSSKYSDPGTFVYLKPLPDWNVIYTFHTYDPIAFTHQGAEFLKPQYRTVRGLPWPPGSHCKNAAARYRSEPASVGYINDYCTSGWGDGKFAEYLKPALEWAKRHDVPLFAGEFGVRSVAVPEPDRLRWLSMAHSFFERNRMSWGLWSFDDCYGLSLKVQGACPAGANGKPDTEAGWKRACRTLAALRMLPTDCHKTRPKDIVSN